MSEMTISELIDSIEQLQQDNFLDTVGGIRQDAEFLALKRIHKRNLILHKLIRELRKRYGEFS